MKNRIRFARLLAALLTVSLLCVGLSSCGVIKKVALKAMETPEQAQYLLDHAYDAYWNGYTVNASSKQSILFGTGEDRDEMISEVTSTAQYLNLISPSSFKYGETSEQTVTTRTDGETEVAKYTFFEGFADGMMYDAFVPAKEEDGTRKYYWKSEVTSSDYQQYMSLRSSDSPNLMAMENFDPELMTVTEHKDDKLYVIKIRGLTEAGVATMEVLLYDALTYLATDVTIEDFEMDVELNSKDFAVQSLSYSLSLTDEELEELGITFTLEYNSTYEKADRKTDFVLPYESLYDQTEDLRYLYYAQRAIQGAELADSTHFEEKQEIHIRQKSASGIVNTLTHLIYDYEIDFGIKDDTFVYRVEGDVEDVEENAFGSADYVFNGKVQQLAENGYTSEDEMDQTMARAVISYYFDDFRTPETSAIDSYEIKQEDGEQVIIFHVSYDYRAERLLSSVQKEWEDVTECEITLTVRLDDAGDLVAAVYDVTMEIGMLTGTYLIDYTVEVTDFDKGELWDIEVAD